MRLAVCGHTGVAPRVNWFVARTVSTGSWWCVQGSPIEKCTTACRVRILVPNVSAQLFFSYLFFFKWFHFCVTSNMIKLQIYFVLMARNLNCKISSFDLCFWICQGNSLYITPTKKKLSID